MYPKANRLVVPDRSNRMNQDEPAWLPSLDPATTYPSYEITSRVNTSTRSGYWEGVTALLISVASHGSQEETAALSTFRV